MLAVPFSRIAFLKDRNRCWEVKRSTAEWLHARCGWWSGTYTKNMVTHKGWLAEKSETRCWFDGQISARGPIDDFLYGAHPIRLQLAPKSPALTNPSCLSSKSASIVEGWILRRVWSRLIPGPWARNGRSVDTFVTSGCVSNRSESAPSSSSPAEVLRGSKQHSDAAGGCW